MKTNQFNKWSGRQANGRDQWELTSDRSRRRHQAKSELNRSRTTAGKQSHNSIADYLQEDENRKTSESKAMKRSKVPFTVKYNKLLDLAHKTFVTGCIVFSGIGLFYIGYGVYHIKYVRHPMIREKEQELLSKQGETI